MGEPSSASLSQRTLQIPASTSETIQTTSHPFVRTGDLGLSQEYQMVTEPSSVEAEEQLKVQSQLKEEGPSSSKYSTKGKGKSEVSK